MMGCLITCDYAEARGVGLLGSVHSLTADEVPGRRCPLLSLFRDPAWRLNVPGPARHSECARAGSPAAQAAPSYRGRDL